MVRLKQKLSRGGTCLMRSMTGFGLGHCPFAAGQLCVELKSLNHRYLDVRVRVPTEFADHAFYLEHLARTRLVRGRFDIQLRTEGRVACAPRLDADRVRALYRELMALRDELTPNSEIPLAALLGIPTIYVESDERHAERVRDAIQSAFLQAHANLEAMREGEGTHLAKVLTQILDRARELIRSCSERASLSVHQHRDRLRDRISRLLDDPNIVVDSARLEQEVAMVADRCDVSEELARLDCHFNELSRLIASAEPSGRRMDFLLQEIGRESNTLGAKSQDAALSHLVVELKAESERMREQVQNVE